MSFFTSKKYLLSVHLSPSWVSFLKVQILIWSPQAASSVHRCALGKLYNRDQHCNIFFSSSLQLPSEDEVLLQKLREESRAVFLQRKSRELLDNDELQVEKCFINCTVKPLYMDTSPIVNRDTSLICTLHSVPGLSLLVRFDSTLCIGLIVLISCFN